MATHVQCRSFDELAQKLGQYINEKAEELGGLNGRRITVGIKDDATYPNGTKVKVVADKIEYGSFRRTKDGREIRIAPRPFLRTTIIENKDKWMDEIGEKCVNIAAGKGSNYKQALGSIGKKIEEAIKENITSMGAVRTGTLRDSITAEVV